MSIITFKDNAITLADYSYNAIATQTKKIIKYEEKILTEDNPENLHQLRVAMRKLRSILSVFNSTLKLPLIINDKNIGDLARILGKQRDLDILKINLQDKFNQGISNIETQFIEKIIADINKPSSQDTQEIKLILSTKKYHKLKKSLLNWLDKPQFKGMANVKIQSILPFLLFPQISYFYLQSAWFIGTTINENGDILVNNLSKEEVNLLIDKEGKNLHKLRKEAKKTRYQLELFTDFYPIEYTEYIDFIKNGQEVLGVIQDNICLQDYLNKEIGKKWLIKLPNLYNLIIQDQYIIWQKWQQLQTKIFTKDYQSNLMSIINFTFEK
ncbi:CHAD domain-containing protein [Geminocystis sp.]|uniref:CHAD domain-containing protein n=1 Tax=Geminocystis sp. TaxID=2664100 RepID=UPI003593980D